MSCRYARDLYQGVTTDDGWTKHGFSHWQSWQSTSANMVSHLHWRCTIVEVNKQWRREQSSWGDFRSTDS